MWETGFAVHLSKAEVPPPARGPAPISRFHSNRQTPNYHPRLTLAEAIAAFLCRQDETCLAKFATMTFYIPFCAAITDRDTCFITNCQHA